MINLQNILKYLKKYKNIILTNLFIVICYLIILTVIKQIGIDNSLANTYLYTPRLTFLQTVRHIYNRAIYWNLRIGETVYFIVGSFPKYIFYIVSSLNFVIFSNLMLFYTFGNIKKIKNYSVLLLFCSILIFFLTPAFSEIFLWEAGTFNQLFDTIIVLLAGIPFRYLQENKNIFKDKKIKLILFYILFLIAGFSTENIVPVLITYMIITALFYYKKNKKILKWTIGAPLCTATCFLIMVCSESTKIRINAFNNAEWAIITKNKMFINFFKYFILILFITLILTILYFIYCKLKKKKILSKNYNILIINLAISSIALFSQVVGKYVEIRSLLLISFSFFNIIIFYINYFIINRITKIKYINLILILQILLLLIYSLLLRFLYIDYNSYNVIREKYIDKQILNNEENIRCPNYDNKYHIPYFEYRRLYSFQFLYCDSTYLNYKYSSDNKNTVYSKKNINVKKYIKSVDSTPYKIR